MILPRSQAHVYLCIFYGHVTPSKVIDNFLFALLHIDRHSLSRQDHQLDMRLPGVSTTQLRQRADK